MVRRLVRTPCANGNSNKKNESSILGMKCATWLKAEDVSPCYPTGGNVFLHVLRAMFESRYVILCQLFFSKAFSMTLTVSNKTSLTWFLPSGWVSRGLPCRDNILLFVLNAISVKRFPEDFVHWLAQLISMADDMLPSIFKLVFDQYGILEAYCTCRGDAVLINTVTVVVIDYLYCMTPAV